MALYHRQKSQFARLVVILQLMTVEIATTHCTSEYKGKTYYFCAAGCKRSLNKEPEKYTEPSPR